MPQEALKEKTLKMQQRHLFPSECNYRLRFEADQWLNKSAALADKVVYDDVGHLLNSLEVAGLVMFSICISNLMQPTII